MIGVRRLIYLQNILKKHDKEIVKKVYVAQKKAPCTGDWVILVEEDRLKYNIEYSDKQIAELSYDEFKKYVKKKVRKQSFDDLKNIQNGHRKVKHIKI